MTVEHGHVALIEGVQHLTQQRVLTGLLALNKGPTDMSRTHAVAIDTTAQAQAIENPTPGLCACNCGNAS